mgnify:CR=1 FL=1
MTRVSTSGNYSSVLTNLMSAQQRQVATRQWLDQHFQGTEKLRASALLGL